MNDDIALAPSQGLMTTAEVLDYLSCSRRHLLDLRQRGELPTVMLGRACRFRRVDVEAFIQRNLVGVQ